MRVPESRTPLGVVVQFDCDAPLQDRLRPRDFLSVAMHHQHVPAHLDVVLVLDDVLPGDSPADKRG